MSLSLNKIGHPITKIKDISDDIKMLLKFLSVLKYAFECMVDVVFKFIPSHYPYSTMSILVYTLYSKSYWIYDFEIQDIVINSVRERCLPIQWPFLSGISPPAADEEYLFYHDDVQMRPHKRCECCSPNSLTPPVLKNRIKYLARSAICILTCIRNCGNRRSYVILLFKNAK